MTNDDRSMILVAFALFMFFGCIAGLLIHDPLMWVLSWIG